MSIAAADPTTKIATGANDLTRETVTAVWRSEMGVGFADLAEAYLHLARTQLRDGAVGHAEHLAFQAHEAFAELDALAAVTPQLGPRAVAVSRALDDLLPALHAARRGRNLKPS